GPGGAAGRAASGGGVRSGRVGPPSSCAPPAGRRISERVTPHERTPPPDDRTRPSRALPVHESSSLVHFVTLAKLESLRAVVELGAADQPFLDEHTLERGKPALV